MGLGNPKCMPHLEAVAMSERVPGVDRSKNFKTSQKLFREISLFYVLTTNGVGGRQRKGKNTRECKQNTFIRQG